MRLITAVALSLLIIGTGIALAAGNSSGGEGESEQPAGVEIPAKRTETSDTFRLPNGAFETQISETPINYENGKGEWQPIDESLEAQADGSGFINGANGFDLSLPERLGEAPVRLSSGDEWVSAKLLGAPSEAGEAHGSEAEYEGANPATSFDLTSLPNGLKEDIELADPSAPRTYSFELEASDGLAPVLRKDGSIAFESTEGEVFAEIPKPVMYDSTPEAPLVSEDIHYELGERTEAGWKLTIVPSDEWLENPELTWPVRLDPPLVKNSPTDDCMISGTKGTKGTTLCGSGGQKELFARYKHVGSNDEWSRTLLKFDLSGLPEPSEQPYIASATLSAHSPSSALNTSGVELKEVSKSWSKTGGVNWLNASTFVKWTNEGGDYTSDGSQILTSERGSGAGWWEFDATGIVQNWAYNPAKFPLNKDSNNGVILKLIDEKKECCSERAVAFDSSAATNSEFRPKLNITYYGKAPSESKVSSPMEGTKTARRLKLKAHWAAAGVTAVTFQWREGEKGVLPPKGVFKTIPTSLVKNTKGEEVKWPIYVSEVNETAPVFFDAAHASSALRSHGGPVEVRALFDSPSPSVAGFSVPAKATVDRFIGGTSDATAPIGPGSVDLLTGNFTLSRQDVSIPGVTSGLEFSRTFNSRAAKSETPGVFGPGWKPGVSVEEAGGAEWQSIWDASGAGEGSYVLLTDLEGYEYAFEQTGETTYATPPELSGWELKREGETKTEMVLKDPAGNSTTFKKSESDFTYVPVKVSEASGGANSTQMVYQTYGSKLRLTKIIAANPYVECTDANSTTTVGCRSLVFNYQIEAQWGGGLGKGERLGSLTYYGPTSGNSMSSWVVAEYKYNKEGQLIEEWDPRLATPLKEKYAYASGGQIQTITPPGEEPWTLEYGSWDEEEANGRLVAVKRASLVESPKTAQTTIAYGVPISGGEAPYQMSGTEVAKWGQTDIPTDATAIFGPDELPSNPPTKYTRATVFYMDAEGHNVNVATPSGAGESQQSITTSEVDEYGNVVRELSADNRLRALAKGSESAKVSEKIDTKRKFGEAGTEMQEEWGPTHEVQLESGTTTKARLHTVVQFDQGWPGSGLKPHLPTTTSTSALLEVGGEADARVAETKYDWTLRLPTETIVNKGGLESITHTAYNTYGQIIETRQPASTEAGDAYSSKIVYYSVLSGCGTLNPGYYGLPCEAKPGKQPGTEGQPEILVKEFKAYSPLAAPTEVIERPGGKGTTTRKTLTTYDTAGRQLTWKQEGGGTAIPTQETLYWPETGQVKTQRFCEGEKCSGSPERATTTTYDALGRVKTYVDADGVESSYSYDLLGRPVSVYDGKGTQTMSYDSTSGLLTSLTDSEAGTFTAAYDAEGNMTEEGAPDGLVAKTTYDEAGEATNLAYVKTNYCSVKCTWLEFAAKHSIYGQVLSQTSTLSSQSYTYDKLGRLTKVEDKPQGGECATRVYNYDKDSNRTKFISYKPGVGGACSTSSGETLQEYKYDGADRLIGPGKPTYDSFGRITSLPSEYAGGSTLTTSYFSDDMVASQSQAGLTNTYALDGSLRQRELKVTGMKELTEVFHYANGSDSPSWTARGSSWTRYVGGIGGGLGAIQDSSEGTSLQLTNLHGDIVATASANPTVEKLTATFEFDEFGNPKSGKAGRFGWLGGKQRRTELPSGVIQMGARSYVPGMGRFISTDPIPGGSANAYDYANADPGNSFDLMGTAAEACKSSLGIPHKSKHNPKRVNATFKIVCKGDINTHLWGELYLFYGRKLTGPFHQVDTTGEFTHEGTNFTVKRHVNAPCRPGWYVALVGFSEGFDEGDPPSHSHVKRTKPIYISCK